MQHVEITDKKLITGLGTRWTPILDSIHDDIRVNWKSSMGEKKCQRRIPLPRIYLAYPSPGSSLILEYGRG